MVVHSNNPAAGEEETGSFLGSPANQPNFVGKVQATERVSKTNPKCEQGLKNAKQGCPLASTYT